MKNIVITIGREYGSGGKFIGSEVAKRLGINFYDKELITKTYEKNGCNYYKLEEYDEKKKNALEKGLNILSVTNYEESFNDSLYQTLISNTIKDLSEHESCVIIGRNSNQVLKNRDNVINLFIYANDFDFKIKRKMDIEKLNEKETLKKLKYVDKKRKEYYEYLNKNSIWGDKKDYDYMIDSSKLGIDKTIDLIVDIYKRYQDK